MRLRNHPFETIDWSSIKKIELQGESGFAISQTIMMGSIRIRMVEYSMDYLADKWCKKGHIIYCIKGKMTTELKNGEIFKLRAGMTYHVGDGNTPHRSSSRKGCILFIVD